MTIRIKLRDLIKIYLIFYYNGIITTNMCNPEGFDPNTMKKECPFFVQNLYIFVKKMSGIRSFQGKNQHPNFF